MTAVRALTCSSSRSLKACSSASDVLSLLRASSSVLARVSISASPDTVMAFDQSPPRMAVACWDSRRIGLTTDRESVRATSTPMMAMPRPESSSPRLMMASPEKASAIGC